MVFEKLLRRAFDILLERKFLIVMGILAALANGFGGSAGGSGGGSSSSSASDFPTDLGSWAPQIESQMRQFDALPILAGGVILALICFFFFLFLIVWVVGTVAHGGLIAGVNAVEEKEETSFGQAWQAAWQRVWRLVGINLIPGIPLFIMFLAGVVYFFLFIGLAQFADETGAAIGGTGALFTFICFLCIGLPVVLILSALRTFAYRACMLEGQGVIDSYRRGWDVLRNHLGEAIILFLLQLAIQIVLGILLFLPGLVAVLCCLLWPLLLIVSGAVTAYFSTLWTLAWREWTGMTAAATAEIQQA